MAKIIGQIDSLKTLKSELRRRGIKEFNSVGQINRFIANYSNEKQNILEIATYELDAELVQLKRDQVLISKKYKEAKEKSTKALFAKISKLEKQQQTFTKKAANKNILTPLYFIAQNFYRHKKQVFQRNFDDIVNNETTDLQKPLLTVNEKINYYSENKDALISQRSATELKKLNYKRDIIENLKPLIAGAVGENLVVKELKKLSSDSILINDFQANFDPPLYNRKENDYIYSIQIDHLLISPAGLFVIETKNWSQKSIDNLSLRSPVNQIRRSSYALYRLLNEYTPSSSLDLNEHHWGEKEIPIRNLIVMINNKPKQEFKFVKVKTRNEVNNYINYFDPVFNSSEIKNIYNFLQYEQSNL